jgi:hypothetical protein
MSDTFSPKEQEQEQIVRDARVAGGMDGFIDAPFWTELMERFKIRDMSLVEGRKAKD